MSPVRSHADRVRRRLLRRLALLREWRLHCVSSDHDALWLELLSSRVHVQWQQLRTPMLP